MILMSAASTMISSKTAMTMVVAGRMSTETVATPGPQARGFEFESRALR